MRRGQSALEYLLMLASTLILVAIVFKLVINTTKTFTKSINDYILTMRKKFLEEMAE